jgi:hypothetical protein
VSRDEILFPALYQLNLYNPISSSPSLSIKLLDTELYGPHHLRVVAVLQGCTKMPFYLLVAAASESHHMQFTELKLDLCEETSFGDEFTSSQQVTFGLDELVHVEVQVVPVLQQFYPRYAYHWVIDRIQQRQGLCIVGLRVLIMGVI